MQDSFGPAVPLSRIELSLYDLARPIDSGRRNGLQDLENGIGAPKLLHDFNAMKFEARTAPY